ncbi:MAG: gliding motility protein GldD [Aureispira sp.]
MPIVQWMIVCWCVLLLIGCEDERLPIPKPRTYPKVDYPARNYVSLDKNYCAFTFEYPDYMVFERDSVLINQKAKHPCWFILRVPSLNGSIHFTYTDIGGKNTTDNLLKIIQDSYTLTEKHNIKATGRTETPFTDAERDLFGITYEVDGNVASPYHFVVTDSLEHAVWASLYFNSQPNADSLAPITAFVQQDMEHIVNTIRWNTTEENQ